MSYLYGKYRIYPLNTYFNDVKKCLSVQGDSPVAWSPIVVTDYNQNDSSQVFTFEKIENQWKIVTCYSKQVFDVKQYMMEDGSPVIQYPDHGGGNQHWDIIMPNKQLLNPILMILGIDVNKVPDNIYNISISNFQLTILNNQAIIKSDALDLYILEEVK